MLSPSAVLLFSGILLSRPEVADQKPTDSGVTAELKQYYEYQSHRRAGVTPSNREPWAAPLRQLTSADVHERRRASAQLCALLKRALADEQCGVARWQRLPYWIPSARNAARTVREQVVSSLSEMKPPPQEALPILRWYFDAEPSGPLQVGAMTTLAQVDGKEANALCIDLAVKPHDNSLVAVGALEQIAARKIAIPAIDLIRLCHHHRASIREAARALNKQQGGADPGNFDPLKAMNSLAIRKLLEQLAPLIVDLPPADAKFVEVEIPVDNPNSGRPRHKARGWLLKETEGSIELLTPFGERACPSGRSSAAATVTAAQLDDTARSVRKRDTSLPLPRIAAGAGLYENFVGCRRAGQCPKAARVSALDAAIEAASVQLRLIVMTSRCFIPQSARRIPESRARMDLVDLHSRSLL